ncbi:HAMP domain-containing protein [Fluviicola taffensis]|uniref:HAMP domain-containing protein n=1 Tax=Fluviicola taffensis TaxID=191579 RepID=UPI0002F3BAD6|nr:HAMP domain-containing protein [Fluviicola taffensis]
MGPTKIWHKLLFGMLISLVISLAAVSLVVYKEISQNITKKTNSRLVVIRNLKKQQVETYFDELRNQTELMSSSKSFVNKFIECKEAFREISEYQNIDNQLFIRYKKHRDSIYFNKVKSFYGNRHLSLDLASKDLANNKEALIIQNSLWDVNFPIMECTKKYREVEAKIGARTQRIANKIGFHDVILIDSKTGDIIFTNDEHSEIGANVLESPYNNTSIRKAFDAVRGYKDARTFIVDFESYPPSNNKQTAFIACPIIKDNINVGILVAEIGIEKLDDILTFNRDWGNQNMGKTGEVYLVGSDNYMRSQSRFFIENKDSLLKIIAQNNSISKQDFNQLQDSKSSIKSIKINSEASKRAIAGEFGVIQTIDYRGVPTLGAYSPLKLNNVYWGIVSKMDQSEAFSEIDELRYFLIITYLIVLILSTLIALFIAKRIAKPIQQLNHHAKELSTGNFNTSITVRGNDEIGELASSFRIMQNTIVHLIDSLTDTNKILSEKSKDLFDSIAYAQQIQKNIFPSKEMVNSYVPDSFVFFQPKDIVSGDFYWAAERNKELYLGVCDSTGHGIPGAFMSLLNVSFLNEALMNEKIEEPGDILEKVRGLLKSVFQYERQDGMDGILIRFNPNTNVISYAASNNALF